MSLSDPPTIEDKIVAAIHELCRIAGGIYDYPDARRTRDVFSKFGLMIRERPEFKPCGHLVDELDLEEVLQHLEPGHEAPTKQ